VDAWVVPDGFFSKGEGMNLSRGDSVRLGYRHFSEEEDSVDDGEDMLPSEWVPGLILTSAEVPAQIRREVKRFPVATSMEDLKIPANLPTVEFAWAAEIPGELNPVRRLLTAEEKELLAKREAELVAAGVYEYGDSTYSCNWLLVKKPKGSLRDVIDLRPVDQFMLASAHPLSDVEDIKAEILGYSCKVEFDLKVTSSKRFPSWIPRD
jgi:hypothetical protein